MGHRSTGHPHARSLLHSPLQKRRNYLADWVSSSHIATRERKEYENCESKYHNWCEFLQLFTFIYYIYCLNGMLTLCSHKKKGGGDEATDVLLLTIMLRQQQ